MAEVLDSTCGVVFSNGNADRYGMKQGRRRGVGREDYQ